MEESDEQCQGKSTGGRNNSLIGDKKKYFDISEVF